MKTIFKILSIAFLGIALPLSFASASATVAETSVVPSAVGVTVSYILTGHPQQTTKIYASIAEVGVGWLKRDIYLTQVAPTDPTPLALDVTFKISELNLVAGKTYLYYLADAPADPLMYLTNPKCFTTTGPVSCSGGSSTPAPSPTSPTTTGGSTQPEPAQPPLAPGTVTVPENPNPGSATGTGTGSGTVSFSPLTGGGTLVDGKCGAVNGETTSVITATSINLCAAGTTSSFVGTGPWTWSCVGAYGGKTVNCSAEVATDEDLGNNFLKNPLAPGLDTFPEIFAAIMNNIVLPIAIPFLAIMLIYSGFLFVKARGNPEELKTAKGAFQYTLIGGTIILGALVFANALQATVSQLLS